MAASGFADLEMCHDLYRRLTDVYSHIGRFATHIKQRMSHWVIPTSHRIIDEMTSLQTLSHAVESLQMQWCIRCGFSPSGEPGNGDESIPFPIINANEYEAVHQEYKRLAVQRDRLHSQIEFECRQISEQSPVVVPFGAHV